jgi:hypothetical protein
MPIEVIHTHTSLCEGQSDGIKVKMFPSTVLLIFLIIYFMEWYHTILSYERKTLSKSKNETTLVNFEQYVQVYFSKGLSHLIEILSFYFQFTCKPIAGGIQWLFHNQSSVVIFVLLSLFSYRILNRRSDTFTTMSDVFYFFREDFLSAISELY